MHSYFRSKFGNLHYIYPHIYIYVSQSSQHQIEKYIKLSVSNWRFLCISDVDAYLLTPSIDYLLKDIELIYFWKSEIYTNVEELFISSSIYISSEVGKMYQNVWVRMNIRVLKVEENHVYPRSQLCNSHYIFEVNEPFKMRNYFFIISTQLCKC